MAFLTSDELKTHLYAENITAIANTDTTIVTAAIDGAVSEAKGYLAAFDIATIFAATGASRNALLLIFIKDMAVWHFITLCNAGTELDFRQTRYDRAISWLKAVQKGDVMPDLPKATATDTSNPATIVYGSNTKREQHF